MSFIEHDLEIVLSYLSKVKADQKPLWGTMNGQQMIEHLTDVLRIATGENPQGLLIDEERIPKMHEYLASDKPMPQNFKAAFVPEKIELRNEEIDLAVDEFVDAWLHFEELFESNEGMTQIHPYYGPLNYAQWQRINSKHLTHHFTQFGLIGE